MIYLLYDYRQILQQSIFLEKFRKRKTKDVSLKRKDIEGLKDLQILYKDILVDIVNGNHTIKSNLCRTI